LLSFSSVFHARLIVFVLALPIFPSSPPLSRARVVRPGPGDPGQGQRPSPPLARARVVSLATPARRPNAPAPRACARSATAASSRALASSWRGPGNPGPLPHRRRYGS
jgi:hypothetical protein